MVLLWLFVILLVSIIVWYVAKLYYSPDSDDSADPTGGSKFGSGGSKYGSGGYTFGSGGSGMNTKYGIGI